MAQEMKSNEPEIESRWPHRIGCLLVCVVFPLIWVGNLVTTTDAGMAVPDWPNTYGYNLFLYPYREWFFGPWDLFVEHGHRLLASLAGVISIALVVATFRKGERGWVKWFSAFILSMVIFQGILGGVRVIFDERFIAKIHGCVGPLFFASSVAFCVVTSRWWGYVSRQARLNIPLKWTSRIAQLMLVTSFGQLALGAFIRHIDDVAMPKHFMLLVAMHITTAVLLVIGTSVQFVATRGAKLNGSGVKWSINILTLLIFVQFCLGLGTWVVKWGWPIWFENYAWAASFVIAEKSFFQINLVTAHAAVGSLILAFWTVHALRMNRVNYLGRGEKAIEFPAGAVPSSIA